MIPIKALIWDLDGTLIQFKINSIKARRKGLEILRNYGMPKDQLSTNLSIIENVGSARKYFKDKGYPHIKIDHILKEVNNAVIAVEREAALKATLINGIDTVLDFARNKHLKQAIFTYNTHQNALLSLKVAKIEHFFDIIAGRDDVKTLKPHPDHLKFICNKLKLSFQEILIIGDTSRDIEAALNVGSPSIALETHIPLLIDRDLFIKANKIIKQEHLPAELIKSLHEFL